MDRQIIFASLLLAASPLVAGCMPDNARTHLDWGVNTTAPRHVAAKDSAKTYVYDDSAARTRARVLHPILRACHQPAAGAYQPGGAGRRAGFHLAGLGPGDFRFRHHRQWRQE